MKYCIHCGSPVKPEARFCGKCGQTIKTFIQPGLETQKPVGIPFCPVCNSMVSSGSRFCKTCGEAIPSVLPASGSRRPTIAPIVQQPLPAKRKRKGLRVVLTLLLMVPGFAVLFYFLGTVEKQPDDVSVVPEPVSLTESLPDTLTEYAVTSIEDIAQTAEQVFLQADTAGLSRILAPTTLERQRTHFKALQPHMKAFGEDFRNRKVLYANERYAVYEFECSRGKFTVDFCLGEDGTWKLMRY